MKQVSFIDGFEALCKKYFGYTSGKLFERIQKGLKVELATAQRVVGFAGAIGHLIYEYDTLTQERIAKLEAELKIVRAGFKKNPTNSDKSPSSEKHRKIKNSREQSGKLPGAQKGHPGATHELHESPDHIHKFEPTKCSECRSDLRNEAIHEIQRHQEVEVEEGKMVITEYQRVIKFCSQCGRWNRASLPGHIRLPQSRVTFGPNVKAIAVYLMTYQLMPVARTQEILVDLWGVQVSQGSLCNFANYVGERLLGWERDVRAELLMSPTLHVDESGIRVKKSSAWVHVYSSGHATLLYLHNKRGLEAHQEIGILPLYKGHLVHDAFAPYFTYGSCTHSLCNAHILRELKYLNEEEAQGWALRMQEFLKATLHSVHAVGANVVWEQKIKNDYRSILRAGYTENSAPQLLNGPEVKRYDYTMKNGKRVKIPVYKREANTNPIKLLNRLRDRMDEVLSFALYRVAPFTNNQAERDLRMTKIKEKVSGCFRSVTSAEHFLRIRSFISTCIKQGNFILDNLVLVQIF